MENRPSLGGVFPRKLAADISFALDRTFDETEILAALKECSKHRAPGPDGFGFSFVKKGWVFMKALVMQFFTEFQNNGKLTKCINTTFVA